MLKQLILTKRIAEMNAKLTAAREKDAGLETRRAALQQREAELEASVNEVTEETSEEDRKVVDDAVAEFEANQAALEKERGDNETEKSTLEAEIEKLTDELDEINKKAAQPPAAPRTEERTVDTHMNTRSKFFKTHEERAAFAAHTEVKDFLQRVRGLASETRAVSGAGLTIPEVMLELLRDNMYRYSKLITKIRLKTIQGRARQNITGVVPEAIWTEAVGALNELALAFSQVDIDGYMIGGFIPIPNATLQDSDLNLADEIMDVLGQSLGLGVDKAIVYGTGVKMPTGIVTRLAQTAKPAAWSTNGPEWKNLSASNLVKFDPTGMTAQEFFATLITYLGIAEPNYSASGRTFWAMNRQTRINLLAKAITFNASGAIVSGQTGTMPVEGGEIVELPFIPTNDIIGGFGDVYLLGEREGAEIGSSEHVRFIQHQTVFKGTARYDGMPVIGGAFVAVNIANANVTTSVSFAADTAN